MKRRILLLAAWILVTAGSGTVLARDEADPEGGFPAYAVARLVVRDGAVAVRNPEGPWEEAEMNMPLVEGARVRTEDEGEAEIRFHDGQSILLYPDSELEVGALREDRSSFRVRYGEIRVDLPAYGFLPVRLNLPGEGASVRFTAPGRYRLASGDERDDPHLSVREGEATVSTDGGRVRVRAGEEASIGAEVRVTRHSFDPDEEWEEELPPPPPAVQKRIEAPPAVVFELNAYGDWSYLSSHGYVWRPRVTVGWAPFFYGRWTWVFPFGWTWVADEPWGWYPYHSGSWIDDPVLGWCWSPRGSFVAVSYRTGRFYRPVRFVPATVRFVREGANVRWVPLRPGERFVRPAFPRGDARLRRWERTLPQRTVYVRPSARTGEAWRDWSTVRRERSISRESVGRERGRERGIRGGTPPAGGDLPPRIRHVPGAERGPAVDRGTGVERAREPRREPEAGRVPAAGGRPEPGPRPQVERAPVPERVPDAGRVDGPRRENRTQGRETWREPVGEGPERPGRPEREVVVPDTRPGRPAPAGRGERDLPAGGGRDERSIDRSPGRVR